MKVGDYVIIKPCREANMLRALYPINEDEVFVYVGMYKDRVVVQNHIGKVFVRPEFLEKTDKEPEFVKKRKRSIVWRIKRKPEQFYYITDEDVCNSFRCDLCHADVTSGCYQYRGSRLGSVYICEGCFKKNLPKRRRKA